MVRTRSGMATSKDEGKEDVDPATILTPQPKRRRLESTTPTPSKLRKSERKSVLAVFYDAVEDFFTHAKPDFYEDEDGKHKWDWCSLKALIAAKKDGAPWFIYASNQATPTEVDGEAPIVPFFVILKSPEGSDKGAAPVYTMKEKRPPYADPEGFVPKVFLTLESAGWGWSKVKDLEVYVLNQDPSGSSSKPSATASPPAPPVTAAPAASSESSSSSSSPSGVVTVGGFSFGVAAPAPATVGGFSFGVVSASASTPAEPTAASAFSAAASTFGAPAALPGGADEEEVPHPLLFQADFVKSCRSEWTTGQKVICSEYKIDGKVCKLVMENDSARVGPAAKLSIENFWKKHDPEISAKRQEMEDRSFADMEATRAEFNALVTKRKAEDPRLEELMDAHLEPITTKLEEIVAERKALAAEQRAIMDDVLARLKDKSAPLKPRTSWTVVKHYPLRPATIAFLTSPHVHAAVGKADETIPAPKVILNPFTGLPM